MGYSIGAVAEEIGLPTSTLRYYDKSGLLPTLKRSESGLRVFDENDLAALRLVDCLKRSGLSIKEIKQYMEWIQEGDSTIELRRNMFYDRRKAVEEEMRRLQETLDTLEFKCWYYDTACAAGTEKAVQDMPDEEMPPKMRAVRDRLHRQMGWKKAEKQVTAAKGNS